MKPPSERAFRYLRADGHRLKGRYLPGDGTLITFLPGFRSVHSGDKARAVAAFAAERGLACLRFDYLGHGDSDGDFTGFRISEAIRDAAACIGKVTRKGQRRILVGSSMGGWIAVELVRLGLVEVHGLLLIAPALDFVARRMATLPKPLLEQLRNHGHMDVPDAWAPGESYRLSQRFLADAMFHQTPPTPWDPGMPVSILHGSADDSVPIEASRKLAARTQGAKLMEIEGGDHRLNTHLPELLGLLGELVGP
jgi:pimeloyl-ACP methyl ester carboxylesterase